MNKPDPITDADSMNPTFKSNLQMLLILIMVCMGTAFTANLLLNHVWQVSQIEWPPLLKDLKEYPADQVTAACLINLMIFTAFFLIKSLKHFRDFPIEERGWRTCIRRLARPMFLPTILLVSLGIVLIRDWSPVTLNSFIVCLNGLAFNITLVAFLFSVIGLIVLVDVLAFLLIKRVWTVCFLRRFKS